jgi:hypothetical protein
MISVNSLREPAYPEGAERYNSDTADETVESVKNVVSVVIRELSSIAYYARRAVNEAIDNYFPRTDGKLNFYI